MAAFLAVSKYGLTAARTPSPQRAGPAPSPSEPAAPTTNPVVYVELPGAQHSFDLLSSIRLEAVVDGIEAFLESVAVRDGVGETTGPATGLAECHN